MKRDSTGKFVSNCDGETKQRFSMTLTATVWQLLDEEAKKQGTSRSEVIEQFARSLNHENKQTATPKNENNSSVSAIRAITGSEVTLEAGDRQVAAILENISDAFVAFDQNWRYTYVNQEAARMLGKSPQELLGNRWQDVFPDVAQQNTVTSRALQQVMSQRVTVRLEAFSLASQRWVEMSIFPTDEGIAACFRDISDRKRTEQRRNVQYAITRILAEAKTMTEATPAILQALCENLDWQVGALWKIDSNSAVLRCINYWQAPNVDIQEFVEATQQITFAQGIGLPGRVWLSREPHWICELSKDSNFPRTTLASRVGLQSGFGFPIILGDEILGVIECFSNQIQEPDADLLDMMAAIGSQIGQFIQRKRTETALRDSQELFQSFMKHSPVAAFIKDKNGRYLYVNPWIEQIHKRSQSDLLGKTDFDLLPLALAQQFHANDMAVLVSGQPMQMLETMHQQDGQHSYMSFKFPLRNESGEQVLAGVAIDITEQIQAEAALQQREAELRLITNTVPVLISFVDAQQRYRFNNQKYEEWFGTPAAEMNGKYLWEVLGEAAYQTIRPYVEQVLAGQEVSFESRIPYKSGNIRDTLVNYVPQFDEQGNVIGFVALVNDISYRKQAEETLRQSEERLRIAQQAANAGVWNWDITNNHVTWSEEYYRLYGLDPAITQPSYENWIGSIIEQDRDRTDQAARAALEHRIDLNVEFRIIHPTKGERWLTAIGQTFYDDNHQPIRMTGIALDITERKLSEAALLESEERYRYLAESIPQLVWTADTTGVLIDVNQRWCNFTGLTLAQAKTYGWQAVVHPDDAARLSQNWAIAQQNGTYYQAEGRMRRADGVYRWHLHQAVPFKNEQGQVIKWFGTATDVEDQKQLEQQRIQLLQQEQAAREQAETANRIKDEFLAVLSHELRTPLNPILGWARLLQSQKLDSTKTTEALKTIERNAKLQAQLIEDLLDVSRILQGKLNLNVSLVDLTSIINAARETVRLAAEAKSITIKTILSANVGQVAGDPSRLQQIVWNLLSNGIKFTPSGGFVEIRLESCEKFAQITVSDNGKGISPEFIPYVFDYFRQADSATTRKFGGLGLGLAIVRHLIELHGGTIQAHSLGEGLGATFTVKLPLMLIQSQTNQDGGQMKQVLDLNGIKILVVDDDADSREFVGFVLEQEGANVTTAGSATEALTALRQIQPDVMLSDIGMPQVDGYMLMQQVRNLPPEQGGNIKAIALTAYAGEINEKQAVKAGFQKHISKPVEPEDLITAIVELVH